MKATFFYACPLCNAKFRDFDNARHCCYKVKSVWQCVLCRKYFDKQDKAEKCCRVRIQQRKANYQKLKVKS